MRILANRVVTGLREALRFTKAKPYHAISRPDQCHECGGDLTLLTMRHTFFAASLSGVSQRHTVSIPVWCCDECPASFHDHHAADIIAAKISAFRENPHAYD